MKTYDVFDDEDPIPFTSIEKLEEKRKKVQKKVISIEQHNIDKSNVKNDNQSVDSAACVLSPIISTFNEIQPAVTNILSNVSTTSPSATLNTTPLVQSTVPLAFGLQPSESTPKISEGNKNIDNFQIGGQNDFNNDKDKPKPSFQFTVPASKTIESVTNSSTVVSDCSKINDSNLHVQIDTEKSIDSSKKEAEKSLVFGTKIDNFSKQVQPSFTFGAPKADEKQSTPVMQFGVLKIDDKQSTPIMQFDKPSETPSGSFPFTSNITLPFSVSARQNSTRTFNAASTTASPFQFGEVPSPLSTPQFGGTQPNQGSFGFGSPPMTATVMPGSSQPLLSMGTAPDEIPDEDRESSLLPPPPRGGRGNRRTRRGGIHNNSRNQNMEMLLEYMRLAAKKPRSESQPRRRGRGGGRGSSGGTA